MSDLSLWDEAADIGDENRHHRLWLVWTVGAYPTGVPWIELHAIYTKEEYAKNKKKALEEHVLPTYPNALGMIMNRAWIETRVTNHHYGQEMMELAAHTGNI